MWVMQIKCPRCGYSFDAGDETLVDCPSCSLLIDTRTLGSASNAAGPSRDDRPPRQEERGGKTPRAEASKPRQTARDGQRSGPGPSRNISAILAALFVPGGGHFRIGRPGRGAIYFLGFVLAGVITYLSIPYQGQLPISLRGYPGGVASLYETLSFLVSRKIIYTLVALILAQATSIIDLVIILVIGDRPSRLPESRQ